MKRTVFDYITIVIGIVLFGIGIYFVKTLIDPKGVMLALPYVCIGVGCGLFGQGMGNIISTKSIKNYPEIQKQIEIEKNDERNVTISNRAKAKAFDIMIFVFGALMLSFALMGVKLIVILMLVFAYLLVIGFGIYYRCKYDKEM